MRAVVVVLGLALASLGNAGALDSVDTEQHARPAVFHIILERISRNRQQHGLRNVVLVLGVQMLPLQPECLAQLCMPQY